MEEWYLEQRAFCIGNTMHTPIGAKHLTPRCRWQISLILWHGTSARTIERPFDYRYDFFIEHCWLYEWRSPLQVNSPSVGLLLYFFLATSFIHKCKKIWRSSSTPRLVSWTTDAGLTGCLHAHRSASAPAHVYYTHAAHAPNNCDESTYVDPDVVRWRRLRYPKPTTLFQTLPRSRSNRQNSSEMQRTESRRC